MVNLLVPSSGVEALQDGQLVFSTSSEHVLWAANITCSQKNTCIKSDPHRYSRVEECQQATVHQEAEFPRSASTSSAAVPSVFAVLSAGPQMW
jgi:hypothetical protein